MKVESVRSNTGLAVLLLWALFIIGFMAVTAKCQTVEYVSDVGDSTHVVKINGTEYRALPAEKVVEYIGYRRRVEQLEPLMKTITDKFNELVKVRAQEVDLLKTQVADTEKFWKGQFEKERSLRQTYESNLRKCSSPWFFGYRFCRF